MSERRLHGISGPHTLIAPKALGVTKPLVHVLIGKRVDMTWAVRSGEMPMRANA